MARRRSKSSRDHYRRRTGHTIRKKVRITLNTTGGVGFLLTAGIFAWAYFSAGVAQTRLIIAGFSMLACSIGLLVVSKTLDILEQRRYLRKHDTEDISYSSAR